MAECTFDGCERKHAAKGLCRAHREQHQKGNPLTPIRKWGIPDADRFWQRVDKRDDGCWIWTGYTNEAGYGIFQRHRAHRYAWELLRGPIPDRYLIDHDHPEFGCHNPACVNPDHLHADLPPTNIQRQRGLRSNKVSGERGVRWFAKKRLWVGEVAFTVDGKQTKMSKKSKDRAVVSAWVVEMRNRYHQ